MGAYQGHIMPSIWRTTLNIKYSEVEKVPSIVLFLFYSISCGRQILKPILTSESEFGAEYQGKKSGGISKYANI